LTHYVRKPKNLSLIAREMTPVPRSSKIQFFIAYIGGPKTSKMLPWEYTFEELSETLVYDLNIRPSLQEDFLARSPIKFARSATARERITQKSKNNPTFPKNYFEQAFRMGYKLLIVKNSKTQHECARGH